MTSKSLETFGKYAEYLLKLNKLGFGEVGQVRVWGNWVCKSVVKLDK